MDHNLHTIQLDDEEYKRYLEFRKSLKKADPSRLPEEDIDVSQAEQMFSEEAIENFSRFYGKKISTLSGALDHLGPAVQKLRPNIKYRRYKKGVTIENSHTHLLLILKGSIGLYEKRAESEKDKKPTDQSIISFCPAGCLVGTMKIGSFLASQKTTFTGNFDLLAFDDDVVLAEIFIGEQNLLDNLASDEQFLKIVAMDELRIIQGNDSLSSKVLRVPSNKSAMAQAYILMKLAKKDYINDSDGTMRFTITPSRMKAIFGWQYISEVRRVFNNMCYDLNKKGPEEKETNNKKEPEEKETRKKYFLTSVPADEIDTDIRYKITPTDHKLLLEHLNLCDDDIRKLLNILVI